MVRLTPVMMGAVAVASFGAGVIGYSIVQGVEDPALPMLGMVLALGSSIALALSGEARRGRRCGASGGCCGGACGTPVGVGVERGEGRGVADGVADGGGDSGGGDGGGGD